MPLFFPAEKKFCVVHTCHFFFRKNKTEKRKLQRPRCNWGRKSCGGAKIICARERVVNHKEMTRQKFKMHRFICGIHAGDLWVKRTLLSRCLLLKASIALLHRVHCSTNNCITVNNDSLIEVMKIITGPTGRHKRFG